MERLALSAFQARPSSLTAYQVASDRPRPPPVQQVPARPHLPGVALPRDDHVLPGAHVVTGQHDRPPAVGEAGGVRRPGCRQPRPTSVSSPRSSSSRTAATRRPAADQRRALERRGPEGHLDGRDRREVLPVGRVGYDVRVPAALGDGSPQPVREVVSRPGRATTLGPPAQYPMPVPGGSTTTVDRPLVEGHGEPVQFTSRRRAYESSPPAVTEPSPTSMGTDRIRPTCSRNLRAWALSLAVCSVPMSAQVVLSCAAARSTSRALPAPPVVPPPDTRRSPCRVVARRGDRFLVSRDGVTYPASLQGSAVRRTPPHRRRPGPRPARPVRPAAGAEAAPRAGTSWAARRASAQARANGRWGTANR